MLTLGCVQTAAADEGANTAQTPAAALDTYVIDGITYFNVHSQNFDNPAKYLRELVAAKNDALGGRSMAQLWMETGTGILFGHSSMTDKTYGYNIDRNTAAGTLLSAIGSGSAESGAFKAVAVEPIYAASLRQAVEKLTREIPLAGLGQFMEGRFPLSQENKDLDKQKDVVGAIVYANQSNCYAAVAVYFTDFQAVALLPDNSGTNYVTTTLRDNKTPERTYASNVKNMTLSQVTTTQNVSTAFAPFQSTARTFAEKNNIPFVPLVDPGE